MSFFSKLQNLEADLVGLEPVVEEIIGIVADAKTSLPAARDALKASLGSVLSLAQSASKGGGLSDSVSGG